jgi:hypothetical protein
MREVHFDLADQGMWNHDLYEEPFLVSLKRFARSRLLAVQPRRWIGRGRKP